MALVQISGEQIIHANLIEIYVPVADAAEQSIVTRADVAGSLGGTFLNVFSANNTTIYTFWFDVDNGTKKPAFDGLNNTTVVEVDISADDTADAVATALREAIGGEADFSTGGVSATVTVTNGSAGGCGNPRDGELSISTGFLFQNITKGITAIPAPGAGSVNFLHITGFIWDQKTVNLSSGRGIVPFAKVPVDIIVPEHKIISIIEN